jgi:hypothetical protein
VGLWLTAPRLRVPPGAHRSGPPLARCRSFPGQARVELSGEFVEWNAQCSAEFPQFDHVNPTFSTFAFAYERLRLVEPSCQFDLGYACGPPGSTELSQEEGVPLRMQRFLHAGPSASRSLRL